MKEFDNLWIILGPESSGSVFISKCIYIAVNGQSAKKYSGYGNSSISPINNMVIHRSIPSMRPKRFFEDFCEEISDISTRYRNVNYIFTTRDKRISMLSKIRRFGGNYSEAQEDYLKSQRAFKALVDDDSVFIWNYETMIMIGAPYFYRLYRFFNIESDYIPKIYDGNRNYVFPSLYQSLKYFTIVSLKYIKRKLFRKSL